MLFLEGPRLELLFHDDPIIIPDMRDTREKRVIDIHTLTI